MAAMLLASFFLLVPAPDNEAAAETAIIPAGDQPTGIAFNPANGRIYVANFGSRSVSVIEDTTLVATISFPPDRPPEFVAYNPSNGMMYTSGGGGVSVIDPATNSIVASGIGGEGTAGIAFNPFNNKMYATDYDEDGKVLVIDSETNTITASIPMSWPYAITFNPVSNTMYAAQQRVGTVSVIDSITDDVTEIITLSGISAHAIAFNPLNNKMYVSNGMLVDVIDSNTSTITTITPNANQLRGILFNPSDGKMYLIDRSPGRAFVIDGITVTDTINLTIFGLQYLDFNSANNKMYVTDIDHDSVLVFTPPPPPPPNSAPDCSGAGPSYKNLVPPIVLWPPNHAMKDIAIIGISDPDNNSVTITITTIGQDEPTSGLGDGDQSPDGSGTSSSTAQVRVERSANGDGRVYHIGFTASDGQGGSCGGEVQVSVPLNQNDATAGDQGAVYDSTAP
jgi:YVTN family beta-propeller protein